MIKSKKLVSYFVLFMLILTIAACSSTSKHESTGEYIDDSVITTKVKSVLASDDFIKSFDIGVETYKGTVQLSGFVNSQAAANRATELAGTVKGVISVKNDLIIK
jgi:osmotically-inducible protein OsmY